MSETNINVGRLGMDLERSLNQLQKGKLTYALNAMIEGKDGQTVSYQNESGNELCVTLPEGYVAVGVYTIYEKNLIVYFLTNPATGDSEIGTSGLEDCTYTKVINAPCLNFNVNYPILSAAHRIDNCSTQIFWVDGYNRDRFIDLENLPWEEIATPGACENEITTIIDCNKLSINPMFSIPQLSITSVDSNGTLLSGTYQFAVQYCNATGEGYTSYYSITNPVPAFSPNNVTLDFNAPVNRSIRITVSNLDNTGYYDYFNLAVIKTVNDISTAELVGFYKIVRSTEEVTYTGQKISELNMSEVMEKFPIYEKSNDITTANDILIRSQLVGAERLSYQKIANQITIKWQTWKVPTNYNYEDPLLAANLRGYMRDEVYPFEIVFLLKDGRQTDRFHIPGRKATAYDLAMVGGPDAIDPSLTVCDNPEPLPRWKVYNTGDNSCTIVTDPALMADPCYIGPYQCGNMSYWESDEEYPCDASIWGELAGQKIRHHKFPDSTITHIHDNVDNIFPIGIKISTDQIRQLINNSDLTQDQKDLIEGFKIVRGNRANNKSVVAKGLIHNVGKYAKDATAYYYPNYPYNDVGDDPFISASSVAYQTGDSLPDSSSSGGCSQYQLSNLGGVSPIFFDYLDCASVLQSLEVIAGTTTTVCALVKPYVTFGSPTDGLIQPIPNSTAPCTTTTTTTSVPVLTSFQGFLSTESKQRFVFHSPDTHFYQPYLGNVLKLETIETGLSRGHFVQTKGHARYKLFTNGLFDIALGSATLIGAASGMYGTSSRPFDGVAFMTAYATIKDILQNITPSINYAYQYNSVGNYNNYIPVYNSGNKQRRLDISVYLNPGVASVGDLHSINNFQRESSVYLKTNGTFLYTHEAGAPVDDSRWKPQSKSNFSAMQAKSISSYYASIKKAAVNQYGQIYSYESVDTGFQYMLTEKEDNKDIFGGDIFINKFSYKSKLPYFIDNRVGSLDNSDVFYYELGNIGEPNYWLSTDAVKGGSGWKIYATQVTQLDFEKKKWAYKTGYMYLFSYGIPTFYCESEVNVDLRQAFNNKEGDFFPHVSTDIPDEWLQEVNVSIAYDNTYYYNRTYSKQNKENYFTSLPPDYFLEKCATIYPFRAVFSEPTSNDPLSTFSNNWLIYRPNSFFDFPQNFGKLTSLDGMNYRQVLARFENRSQIYNALLTAPTSQADVYLGQPLFSTDTPPVDLSVTDMGFMGSRHRFLLKTEHGFVFVDDKRGHVFLIAGDAPKNLTSFDSGVEQFFNKNLEVKLPKYFPSVPIDNTFNGVGITGVYDAKYDRFILTKIDYTPSVDGITYVDGVFYYEGAEISLTNTQYFCNRSFSISFDFDTQSWISFHSYIPSFYVGSSNFFISAQNGQTWRHHTANNFCRFYNQQSEYILEYPYNFEYLDEILQSVSDYSKTFQYDSDDNSIQVNDVYFNKVILYNDQQCSGILQLTPKPKANLSEYMKYPLYNTDSKTILYTKSDNFYKINQFWSMVKDHKQPIFKKTCRALSWDKELNQANMDYGKMSFKKAPLRAKDLKCRFILDNRYDTRIVSQLVAIETQKSFK